MRVVVLAIAFAVVATTPSAGAAATIDSANRSVTTAALGVRWSTNDPEQIDSLIWRGVSMTNTGSPIRPLPPDCRFEEYFGNSWTVRQFPFMLVGDSTGSWANPNDDRITISSSSPCSFGGTGIDVETSYKFFDLGPAANKFRVERRFTFGPTAANFAFRPYIPRLFPRTAYHQVLHPNATATRLVVDSVVPCEFGCQTADWDGSWFAAHDPATGRGLILRREGRSATALWIDMDGASFTAASSALLLPPPGGFTGTVVEVQFICLYDRTTWPAASQTMLALPAGC